MSVCAKREKFRALIRARRYHTSVTANSMGTCGPRRGRKNTIRAGRTKCPVPSKKDCGSAAVIQIECRDSIGHRSESGLLRGSCAADHQTGRAARDSSVVVLTNSPTPCLFVRHIPGSAISCASGIR